MGREIDGISVIIPVYERSAKLERTIWSVKNTADLPYELLVSEAKQCVAKNRNAGLEKAQFDLIAFLDDDVLLPPFWMSKLLACLFRHDEIGVMGCRMTNPDGTKQNHLAEIPEDTIAKTLIPGTLMVYSRSELDGCMFDEEYEGSQWEDTDFIAQVKAKGLESAALGAVHILHDNNWTEHTARSWEKNRARFISKWPEMARSLGLLKAAGEAR